MGDGWIDNRQITLINFLVYCSQGISFVKSVNASDIVNDATNLFQLFDEVIEWVYPFNVVHIVTDNAKNYVTSNNRHFDIFLLKKKWTDFLTWCNSLYYTTFIALKSLFYHKHDLQAFVTSKFFVDF